MAYEIESICHLRSDHLGKRKVNTDYLSLGLSDMWGQKIPGWQGCPVDCKTFSIKQLLHNFVFPLFLHNFAFVTIENKRTNGQMVTRGVVGGDNEGKVGEGFQNIYKGHMDKTKSGVGPGEGGGDGWGERKMQTTVLEQQ